VGLTYDALDRPIGVGGNTVAYRPDGVRGYQSSGGGLYYIYDGARPIEALNSTGAVQWDFMYGPAGHLGYRTNGTTAYYTFDPLGNAAEQTDSSANVNGERYPTGAFGALAGTNASSAYWGLRNNYYTVWNSATGLVDLTARLYDPRIGRFVNRDPIGSAGGVDVYAYAVDNPVNGMDPFGTSVYTIGWGGSGGFTVVGGSVEGGIAIEMPWDGSSNFGVGLYGSEFQGYGLGLGFTTGPGVQVAGGNFSNFAGESDGGMAWAADGPGGVSSWSSNSLELSPAGGVGAGLYFGKGNTKFLGKKEWPVPDYMRLNKQYGPSQRPAPGSQQSDWGTGLAPLPVMPNQTGPCGSMSNGGSSSSNTTGGGGGKAY